MERQSSPTRSVERALEILECFLDQDELILLEISERTGLSGSTVLRILSALQEHDFIIKNPINKSYRLGKKIQWLAERMPGENHDELRETAYPFMKEMNERYNEDVRLFVPQGNSKLCIESVESQRELRQVVQVGTRHDLVRGAAGKIILAYMSETERKKLIPDTRKWDTLDEVKNQGYALSNGEREEGLFGLAVPVFGENGELAAAASISGPTVRFNNENLEDKICSMVQMGKRITEAWGKKLIPYNSGTDI